MFKFLKLPYSSSHFILPSFSFCGSVCLQKILISKQSGQHKRAEREQEKKKEKFTQDKEEKKKKRKENLKAASQPLLDIYTTTPLRSKENKNGVCVWLLSAYYRPIKNGKPQKRETLFVDYQIDGEEN